jgi:hypothetical protein
MRWLLHMAEGLSAGLRLQESALYRHPYRSSDEAFRGDLKRIASDIQSVMEHDHE